MKKYISIFVAGLFSIVSFAHNPEVSTTMLVEKENNVWVLQLSASLTAFQQEINTNYAETPYKTPEEFQAMVMEYVKQNLHISYNKGEEVTFSKGIVKLGHETKVVFEVFGTPSEIKSAIITNTVFADIHRSQSALVILKEGFEKKQFLLNGTNGYTIALQANKKQFTQVVEQNASMLSSIVLVSLVGVIGLGFLIINILKRRKMRLLEVR
jgi:hypothetical protein